MSGDTAREIWAATADRFQERAERPGENAESRTVEATDQPSSNPDPPPASGQARLEQPGDRPDTKDWRGAVDATTPEIAKQMLANRTYVARVDIAVENAKGVTPEQSGVNRLLADRWVRFGDRRDDSVSDEDIADTYEKQTERDGPPEAEATFRVGRERVVEAEGPGGLRTPGRLDKAIEAAESILTARGFRASAEQPADQPSQPLEKVSERARDETTEEPLAIERPEEQRTEPRWNPERHEWVEGMPDAERAVLDDRKFRGYSMDPGNENNQGKHEGWQQLGYDVADEQRPEMSCRPE